MSTTHLAQPRPNSILEHAPEGLQSPQWVGEGLWSVLYLLVCAGAADAALLAFELIGVIGYEIEAYCGFLLALVVALYFAVATAFAVKRSVRMRQGHA
jgi:hypothetical protein